MASHLGKALLTQGERQTWVQTDRRAHEAWGRLVHQSPRAAALLHTLVAHMDQSAAVVCSYATLAELSGMSYATIRRAVADLKAGQWIQTVQIGGKGGGLAFVVNSRVAWAARREHLGMAVFSAQVVALSTEQEPGDLEGPPLRRIPVLRHVGERQLPTGQGEDPPSQPALDGLEPELPALAGDAAVRHELEEARGQLRLDGGEH